MTTSTDQFSVHYSKQFRYNYVCQILTKIGTEVCFNEPLMCTKFQPDRSMCSHFMAKNVDCAKRRRKNNDMISRSYFGIGWHDLLQIWYVDSPNLGASQRQIWFNSG